MSYKKFLSECTDGYQAWPPSDSLAVDGSPSFQQSYEPLVPPSPEAENHYDYTVSPNVYRSPAFSKLADTISNKSQSQQSRTPAPSHPPFGPLRTIGALRCWDERTGNVAPIGIGINCIVDKGFFCSEGEWTCYRRNYFSSTCSYALDMGEPGVYQYIQPGSHRPLRVYGFAMMIFAEDADDDQYIIELIQHMPKRDKGPVSKLEPVRLWPESHIPRRGQTPTEHTFERLQFKVETANNGRITQQYFRLVVALLADVGVQQDGGSLIKIAERRSTKLVVRRRSPITLNGYNIESIVEAGTRLAFKQWCNLDNQKILHQPQPLERDVVNADPGSSESSHSSDAGSVTSASEEADAWSLLMQEKKRMVIDGVMKSFCAWLDSKLASIRSIAASQDAAGNSGGAPNSTSGQSATEGNKAAAQGVGHQHKLKRKKTDADDDENHGKRPGPNSKSGEVEPGDEPRRFACPYFKRDPRKYYREANCVGPGWTEVHRVKGHLYRRHALPPQCPRCWQDFKSEGLRDIHIQNDPPCQKRENDTILDGFTKDQEKQLKSRKRSETNTTNEGKWREMYQILFPDDDPATIPGPYHETVVVEAGAPGTNTPADFAAFARREYPRFVRRELEVLFESEFQDVEERVRPRVQDIVLNLQPRLIALYEQSALGTRYDGVRVGSNSSHQSISNLLGEVEVEEAQPVEPPAAPARHPPLDTGLADEEVSNSWLSGNSSEPTAFEVDIDWSFLPEDMFTYPLAGQFSLPQQDMSHRDDLQVAAQRQPTIGT